jgi:hypothetical protein
MIQDWRWWATCAVLAGSLVATRSKELSPPGSLARPLSEIPLELGGWMGTEDPPLRQQIAESLGATAYLLRTYRRGARIANLFIAYYANPRAGGNDALAQALPAGRGLGTDRAEDHRGVQ